MTVKVGSAVLCTIVIDYVPERLRSQVKRLTDALSGTKDDPEAFAEVEIIPGEGFVWDEASKALRGRLNASQLPKQEASSDDFHRQIGEAILGRVRSARAPGKAR